jgi:hypothetical protein
MSISFTCKPVNATVTLKDGTKRQEKRWKCTNPATGLSWFAGPEYRYLGKLASDLDLEVGKLEKPAGDFEKPGGWGSTDRNPGNWRAITMKDDPQLFKVVDGSNINVAHRFPTLELAQQYIEWAKQEYQGQEPDLPPSPTDQTPIPPPPPPPPPAPAGGETIATKDGVRVPGPVRLKGGWKYEVREDWRDGGARFNIPAAGVNLVMVGYFKADSDGGDEVSGKVLGGRHTGSPGEPDANMGTIYDLGSPVGGGKPRMRAEGPHPDYTDTLDNYEFAGNAQSIVGKYKGFCLIVRQETGGVRLTWYQDQGDNETKPANQWVKIYEYFDDGNKIKGIGNASYFPLRNLDHCKGTEQNTWRIDETPGLAQKWIAISEIEPGLVAPPGPTPAPTPIPEPPAPSPTPTPPPSPTTGQLFNLLAMYQDAERFDPAGATVTKNSDGSITLEKGTLRAQCFAEGNTLTSEDKCQARIREYCNKMAELQTRGYWDTPADFRNNLSIKGKVTIEKIKDGGSFTIELNSIDHETDDCLNVGGTGYHFTLESDDGKFNHEKEQYHAQYDKKSPEGPSSGSAVGRAIEFEHRIYEDSTPEKNVCLETYFDGSLVKRTVDKNDWGSDMKTVDSSFAAGQAIRWGSPIIILKANDAKLRFHEFTVSAL